MWNSQPCSWVLSGYSHGLRILPPNLTSQILLVFEIWRFLWFFQKFPKKTDFKNSKKFSILLLEIVRVLSGLATLASEYDCSNPCFFGDMTFFRIFRSFSKNIDIEKFTKFEVLISIVRLCQGTNRSCDFFLQMWLLKSLYFSRYDVFQDFFKRFSENLSLIFFQSLKFPFL